MKNENLNLIGKIIPQDSIVEIEVVDSGFNSDAIIVNKERIFRFPKRPEIYEEYIREQKILNLIALQVSVPTPSTTIHHIDDKLFTEHKLIKGEQYTFAAKNMSVKQKKQLSLDLARFLVQLHNIKTDFAVKQYSLDEYPALKNTDSFPKKYAQQIQKTLSDFAVKNTFLTTQNVVLCHMDLNENNILIKDGKLCGVIDFGSASICDRSVDFAALTKFDCELAKNMAKYYTKISGNIVDFDYAIIIEKIVCYNGIVDAKGNIERQKRYETWLNRIGE